jgi:hypothetical protein
MKRRGARIKRRKKFKVGELSWVVVTKMRGESEECAHAPYAVP